MKKPLVSIIIVNYKTEKEIESCILSIKKNTKVSFEVIVVDNNESLDPVIKIKKKFPWVSYVKSPNNLGFGGGNNFGAKIAKGKYLFFLNPDTIVNLGTVDYLVTFLDQNSKAGIAAPLLTDKNNRPYPLQSSKKLTLLTGFVTLSWISKLFPDNPVSTKFWLKNWNKKEKKEVDVVPGSAFMIRTEIFKKLGGFDEKFFLYFEEHDLCRRVKNEGYKIFAIPQAKVVHLWGVSTEKSSQDINKIFNSSRFYYFKKYYGSFVAALLESFFNFGKYELIFSLILLFGIFLRFYKINDNFLIDGEIGDNLLQLKNFILAKQIPLLGPVTSHPWLYFGPIYYWLYTPILLISKFNPVSYAYFGAVGSSLIILLNYVVISKIVNKHVALFSSFLIAISPLLWFFSRLSRFFSFVPIFVYVFLLILYAVSHKKKRHFFWLGFVLSCMFSFHYSPIVLIPFLISVFLIKKIRLNKNEIFQFLLGLFIPSIPVLIYDSQHKFSMSLNLLLWIPYRVLGFFGIYHKNTLTQTVIKENTLSFTSFFSQSIFSHPTEKVGLGIIIILLIYSVYKIIKQRTYPFLFIFLWGLWGLVAIFIHGSPPSHYFVPILTFPIILVSFLLFDIWKKSKLGKIIVFIFLAWLTVFNLIFYFSKDWIFQYKNSIYSYKNLTQITQAIVKDARGQKFNLKRIGFNDQFSYNYAQNYIYLLWLYGNQPVRNANITYTIIETPEGPNSNITVLKSIKNGLTK